MFWKGISVPSPDELRKLLLLNLDYGVEISAPMNNVNIINLLDISMKQIGHSIDGPCWSQGIHLI